MNMRFARTLPKIPPYAGRILCGILVLAYFSFVQWGQGFADPDSFYHAKVGELMSRGALVLPQFPWFAYTTFSAQFTDHQFFYHLLLAGTMRFASPLIATKSVSIILAVLFILWFDQLLRIEGVRASWIYLAALALTAPFVFRLNLAKAGSLALLLTFAALFALWHTRPLLLACISFVYVWSHAGWIVLFVLAGALIASDIAISKITEEASWRHALLRAVTNRNMRKSVYAIFIGAAAGVILNPYFPHNVIFYWQQAIDIGLVNYQNIIRVGNEWYPPDLYTLLIGLHPIWILIAITFGAFAFLCMRLRKPPRAPSPEMLVRIFHLVLLSGFWFAFTLKSIRYLEYFVPFAVFASALILALVRRMGIAALVRPYFKAHRAAVLLIAIPALLCYGIFVYESNLELRGSLAHGIAWNKFQDASSYIARAAPHDTLIFHTNWSDAPMLFFHNDRNRYMAGLDPTFFYLYDKKLYEQWMAIVEGRAHLPAQAIQNAFHTSYALITLPQDWTLNYELKKSPSVHALFHDAEGTIVYRLQHLAAHQNPAGGARK